MTDPFGLDFSMLKKGMVLGPEHHQFRLLKPVSNSPIGQVWHAEDLASADADKQPAKAALEIVNPKLLQDVRTCDAFKAQVTHAKQLKHKHIAATYGYFQSREGWLFVAMEPVRTRSLARILMEDGYQQLNPDKARIILGQIAQAIDYANKQKISHGDLTPWNVIITPESGVKLVNFAFRQPLLQRIQNEGMRILNGEYHAPESFVSVPLPATVDIYSLACIAYQLFGGFPPFASDIPVDQRDAEALTPPRKLNDAQWKLLKRALDATPGERPGSALELTAGLFPPPGSATTGAPDARAEASPAAAESSNPVPDAAMQIQLQPAAPSGGAGKLVLTATLMFALGLVVGYLVATNQYQARDQQLLTGLGEIHRLLSSHPSPENKIALSGHFAEVRSLTNDKGLVAALQQRVEEYKLRMSRDMVATAQQSSAVADPTSGDKPGDPNSGFTPGAVFKDEIMPDVFGPNMVVLRAGTFLMGDQDRGGDDNERPVHPVTIGQRFALSQHEVTFAEYDLFALTTGRPLPDDEGWGRGDRPVINVSWNEASAYAYWLRKQTGLNYRLPTEAEWEYAARAGTESPYWWGSDIGKGNANCSQCGSRFDGQKSAPVGSFKPNPFGLFDMNGNVYEWVTDCYHASYAEAPADGSSWDSGKCSQRVMRGGSWYDIGRLARSASRYRHSPDSHRNSWGFRLALDLQ